MTPDDVGEDQALLPKTSQARLQHANALATAREMGTLATLVVQQVMRGTAAGVDEVVKAHLSRLQPRP